MAEDRYILQRRLTGFFVEQYPLMGRNEALARDIGVKPRTARNYFANYWPGAHAWRGIVRRFGQDVITAVFSPDIDEARARLIAEIRALEDDLEHRKSHLRSLAGGEANVVEPPGR